MAIDTRSMDELISELKTGRAAVSGNSVKPTTETSSSGFANALQQAIEETNKAHETAESMTKAYISGDKSTSLQEVMITGQRSHIAFEQLAKAKEKLVAAYRDIMNMTV